MERFIIALALIVSLKGGQVEGHVDYIDLLCGAIHVGYLVVVVITTIRPSNIVTLFVLVKLVLCPHGIKV